MGNRSSNEVKRYFEELQDRLVDNRGCRGRKHNLAFVLTSFLMSLLRCTGHVNLAMIHRRIVKKHELMVIDTAFRAKKCVLYVQLGRILDSIDYETFNKVNNIYIDIQTEQIEGL